jgi:FkbM family methyltransferase
MSRPIAYLGNGVLLTLTRFNRIIYLPADDLSVTPHILMQGSWEHWVTNFMQRRILNRSDPRGAIMLDVGANVGWYALTMFFTKEGHYDVWAFEPNPKLVPLLINTYKKNGMDSKRVHQAAVSDKAGELRLNFVGEGMGDSYVTVDATTQEGCFVSSITLDATVPPGSKVAMLKADVEGHEPQVVAGAHRIIEENFEIELFLEHNPSEAEEKMFDYLLGEQGFMAALITTDSNAVPQTREELRTLKEGDVLYFARPPGR